MEFHHPIINTLWGHRDRTKIRKEGAALATGGGGAVYFFFRAPPWPVAMGRRESVTIEWVGVVETKGGGRKINVYT